MSAQAVALATLDPVVERAVAQLKAGHNTALVAAPGCGTTTLSARIHKELTALGLSVLSFDLNSTKDLDELIGRLDSVGLPTAADGRRVLPIDHAARLLPKDFSLWVESVRKNAGRLSATCLWLGSLDSRAIRKDFGLAVHSVPKSHISFPLLARDELLAVYRSIAEASHCVWGEAIFFFARRLLRQ